MCRIWIFILLFIVTGSSVFAQEDDGILWEITGNGAKKSYILGTCHAVEGDFLDSNCEYRYLCPPVSELEFCQLRTACNKNI